MNEIKTLWVARDKYGSFNLFVEKPFSADGEWYSDSHIGQIKDDLLDEVLTYEDSPKKIILSIKEK